MSLTGDRVITLLEDFGDSVDIFYTQFLEVAFFLKVPASEQMAVAFVKRKLPVLTEDEIRFLINEIVEGYYDTL
jgi:hypothetical protein|tara:strand:- start:142 stop:363 length:222 start_codon:yes stop_codon:yes gene_type:complete